MFPEELDPCPDDFDYTTLYEETYGGLALVSRSFCGCVSCVAYRTAVRHHQIIFFFLASAICKGQGTDVMSSFCTFFFLWHTVNDAWVRTPDPGNTRYKYSFGLANTVPQLRFPLALSLFSSMFTDLFEYALLLTPRPPLNGLTAKACQT